MKPSLVLWMLVFLVFPANQALADLPSPFNLEDLPLEQILAEAGELDSQNPEPSSDQLLRDLLRADCFLFIDHELDPSPLGFHFIGTGVDESQAMSRQSSTDSWLKAIFAQPNPISALFRDPQIHPIPISAIVGLRPRAGKFIGISFDYMNWYSEFDAKKTYLKYMDAAEPPFASFESISGPRDRFIDFDNTFVKRKAIDLGNGKFGILMQIKWAVKDVRLFVVEQGGNLNDPNNNYYKAPVLLGYRVGGGDVNELTGDRQPGIASGFIRSTYFHILEDGESEKPMMDLGNIFFGYIRNAIQINLAMQMEGEAPVRQGTEKRLTFPANVDDMVHVSMKTISSRDLYKGYNTLFDYVGFCERGSDTCPMFSSPPGP